MSASQVRDVRVPRYAQQGKIATTSYEYTWGLFYPFHQYRNSPNDTLPVCSGSSCDIATPSCVAFRGTPRSFIKSAASGVSGHGCEVQVQESVGILAPSTSSEYLALAKNLQQGVAVSAPRQQTTNVKHATQEGVASTAKASNTRQSPQCYPSTFTIMKHPHCHCHHEPSSPPKTKSLQVQQKSQVQLDAYGSTLQGSAIPSIAPFTPDTSSVETSPVPSRS